jgi:galactokinase
VDSIRTKQLSSLGNTAHRSQQAGTRLLNNQIPETIRLAELAEELGAHGASAFGAGFGGSVWALVDRSNAVSFLAAWRVRYLHEFPQHASKAEFLLTRPGVPAFCSG